MRFREIFNPEDNPLRITIVGAGSIGSNLALLLARLGMKDITVYDFDEVEDHNLGHQAYRFKDCGRPKVEALREIIEEATGTVIKAINEPAGAINTDILILAVDNMTSRKDISGTANYSFCIDGRMGGETFNIYTFTQMEKERYINTLFEDSEGSDLPCGGKSIGYVSYLIAGMMENALVKLITTGKVPFEQNYCARNFIYSVTE